MVVDDIHGHDCMVSGVPWTIFDDRCRLSITGYRYSMTTDHFPMAGDRCHGTMTSIFIYSVTGMMFNVRCSLASGTSSNVLTAVGTAMGSGNNRSGVSSTTKVFLNVQNSFSVFLPMSTFRSPIFFARNFYHSPGRSCSKLRRWITCIPHVHSNFIGPDSVLTKFG